MKPKLNIQGIEFDAIEVLAMLRGEAEATFGDAVNTTIKEIETFALIIFSEGVAAGIQRERDRAALLITPTKGEA